MSPENKKHGKTHHRHHHHHHQQQQGQQQQQLRTVDREQQLMDRVYTSHSHDVSAKDSENDVLLLKKPFLKKRSGLFRFFRGNSALRNCDGQFPNRGINLYKVPHSHHHHPQNQHSSHHENPTLPSRQRANTNVQGTTTSDSFSMKNSRGMGLSSNGTGMNVGSNRLSPLGHRSTTYNPNISCVGEIKQIKGHHHPHQQQQQQHHHVQKRDTESSSEVQIFEILNDDGNGTDKYSSTAPAASFRNNLKIDPVGFEQGDTKHLLNYHSNMVLNPNLLKAETENPRTFQPIQTGVERDNNNNNINPRNFVIGNSTANAGTSQEPEDFHNIMNNNLSLPEMSNCFEEEEDEPEDQDDQENENLNSPTCISLSGMELESDGENISESSEENFTLTNSPAHHHQFSMSSQLSELNNELMGIKSKVAYLEKNVRNEDGRKTSIVKSNHHHRHHHHNTSSGRKRKDLGLVGVTRSKKEEQIPPTNFMNNSNTSQIIPNTATTTTTMSYQNVVEGIHTGLDRINTDLNEMQSSFLQKMEGLEEEIHVKSQRWCENQIKVADKVHSLFSELESLKNQVKGQQHQVQNLAENVDKEFETVKSEWREAEKSLQNRVKALEEENYKLLEKFQKSSHPNSISTTTETDKGERDLRERNFLTTTDNNNKLVTRPPLVLSEDHVVEKSHLHHHPIQVCNQGSQVSPTSSPFNCEQSMKEDSSQLHKQISNRKHNQSLVIETKLETIGGQIVSSRKTLNNGDIETVYTNGTREIIKADKSEVQHMYRNGDVRTVTTNDGTVTYFYASSSTWQTTYASGVELFKFPNGVIERRLPNGLVEQSDAENRVTFFQATPPKPSQNGLLHHHYPSFSNNFNTS